MKFFRTAPDGGKGSGVTGYFLVEIKPLFSIVLLHFNAGTRESFHSHAFNAVTCWLRGRVIEEKPDGTYTAYPAAGRLKYTPRSNMHRVRALESTWALSFRGPWVDRWQELRNGRRVTLTHGRRIVHAE